MTGPDHYRAAERLLEVRRRQEDQQRAGNFAKSK